MMKSSGNTNLKLAKDQSQIVGLDPLGTDQVDKADYQELKKKLLFSFGNNILLFFILGVTALFGVEYLSTENANLYGESFQTAAKINKIQSEMASIRTNLDFTLATNSDSSRRRLQKLTIESLKSIELTIEGLEGSFPSGTVMIRQLSEQFAKWKTHHLELKPSHSMATEVNGISGVGPTSAALAMNELEIGLYELAFFNEKRTKARFEEAKSVGSNFFYGILIALLYFLYVSCLVTLSSLKRTMKYEAEKKKSQEIMLRSAKLASIGELAAGVGHEVNNPLSIAFGNNEKIKILMERDNYRNEKVYEALGKQNSAYLRIKKIVCGLRNFSRSDGDELEPVAMVGAIEETIEFVAEIFARDGVDLRVKANKEISNDKILGSPGRIQQIIMNLITNARDATEGQDVRWVECSLDDSTESEMVLTVTDNGSGIPEAIQNKVFDAFFTTKSFGKGTGLGLRLVYQMVQDLNGSLNFQSKMGKGTCFRPKIPTMQAEQKEIDVPENQVSWLPPENVLVVDDEADLRELMKAILEDIGVKKVWLAKNGAEALNLIQFHQFDFIFTDLRMPVMDGAQLIENIQNGQFVHRPKVILVTGMPENIKSDADSQSYLDRVEKILIKPTSRATILKILGGVPADESSNAATRAA